jgi:hypothetical protein
MTLLPEVSYSDFHSTDKGRRLAQMSV